MWMLWLVWERRQLGSSGQLCLMLTLHLPSSCRRRSLWKGLALHCLIQVLWSSSSWPGRTFHLCWAVGSWRPTKTCPTHYAGASVLTSWLQEWAQSFGSWKRSPWDQICSLGATTLDDGCGFSNDIHKYPILSTMCWAPLQGINSSPLFWNSACFWLKIARCRSKWTLRKQLVRPSLHYFLLFARWRVHIPNFKGIKLQACHESGTFILSDTI